MSDRRRLREIGATILLVIGGIGLVTASTGWWLERSFLHTSRFTDTANRLLDEDEVQAELASVMVRQLSRRAGTNLQVAEPFLATIVGQVVETDAFRTVFDLALSNAHRVLVNRETGTIILNLTSAYDQVKRPLQQVAPNLARELPSRDELEFVLLHRSQLTTVWDTIDRAKRIVGFLDHRRRAAAGRGRGAGGGPVARGRPRRMDRRGLGSGALRRALRHAVVLRSRISDGVLADAVVASFRVITTPLVVQSAIIVAVAVFVGLVARFAATAGLPALRPAARGAWARVRGAVPIGDGAGSVDTRGLLPAPRVDSRSTRVLRALALTAVGLFAILEPSSVADVLVILAGIALLVLALFEALAAWNASRPTRARSTGGEGLTGVTGAARPSWRSSSWPWSSSRWSSWRWSSSRSTSSPLPS